MPIGRACGRFGLRTCGSGTFGAAGGGGAAGRGGRRGGRGRLLLAAASRDADLAALLADVERALALVATRRLELARLHRRRALLGFVLRVLEDLLRELGCVLRAHEGVGLVALDLGEVEVLRREQHHQRLGPVFERVVRLVLVDREEPDQLDVQPVRDLHPVKRRDERDRRHEEDRVHLREAAQLLLGADHVADAHDLVVGLREQRKRSEEAVDGVERFALGLATEHHHRLDAATVVHLVERGAARREHHGALRARRGEVRQVQRLDG
ncbi:MAG: hypothetical protein RL846_46365 [Deltaproteobacteria bacterium]